MKWSLSGRINTDYVIHYTMEHYTSIKNNDFMKVTVKWLELEKIFLHEVTQTKKNIHDMYSLISGY